MKVKICDFCEKRIVEATPRNGILEAYEIAWRRDGSFLKRGKVKMDICPTCWKDMRDYITIIQNKESAKRSEE